MENCAIYNPIYFSFCSQDTFKYSSQHWTTASTYNETNGLGIHSDQSAKFEIFNGMNCTKICIGLKNIGASFDTTKWLELQMPRLTLLSLFKEGTYISTDISRAKWLEMVPGGVMQPNCNKEGFNNYNKNGARVRIGIIANNQ